MKQAHSAIIVGENFSAFIDGIPDKCDHDDLGGNCHQTVSGKWITPLTFIKWTGYTSQLRDKLIYEHQESIDDSVIMTTVSCSKCKKPFQPNMFEDETAKEN